jgi:hypothetical protein
MSVAAIEFTPEQLRQFQCALAVDVIISARSTVNVVAAIALEQFAGVIERAEVTDASYAAGQGAEGAICSAVELARRMALGLRAMPPTT